MKVTKFTSRVARAMMGLLAAGTGVVALTSTPAQALDPSCLRTNDTDVPLSAWATVESRINIPAGCFAGVGSQVRVDVHIKHAIAGDNLLYAVQADGTGLLLQDYSRSSASEINETYIWNTPAQSSVGTWKLQVTNRSLYGTRGGYIDSWTLTVITPSCWRANYDDVTSDVHVGGPSTPVSTSVSVAPVCVGKASAAMAIIVRLRDADLGGYDLRLFRNDVEVPMTVGHEEGDRTTGIVTVSLTANGSQLDAAGTWKLRLTTNQGKNVSVTMDSWILYTSY
jgi:subtilisin-like proprotein convertase family protein